MRWFGWRLACPQQVFRLNPSRSERPDATSGTSLFAGPETLEHEWGNRLLFWGPPRQLFPCDGEFFLQLTQHRSAKGARAMGFKPQVGGCSKLQCSTKSLNGRSPVRGTRRDSSWPFVKSSGKQRRTCTKSYRWRLLARDDVPRCPRAPSRPASLNNPRQLWASKPSRKSLL